MSRVPRIQSSSREDVEYDNAALEEKFQDTDCWLVALDDWEISILLSSLRYAHWSRRWRSLGSLTWDEIQAKIENLEHCLMAGCNVGELLDKFDTLNINLVTNNEDLVEAINNLSEQFIYRTGEDEEDIAKIVRDTKEILRDQYYDLRNLLLSYSEKGIAQIISELPIAGISTAIENQEITSICSPDVNVEVNCGSGGCSGGCDNPPSQPGTEGGTPPENWTDPPENEDPEFDRKCRVSNMMYDGLYQVINQFNKNDLEDIITTLGVGAGVGIIAAALAIVTGPVGFGLAVLGVVTAIALTFIGQSIDLYELLTILDTNHQSLVCALYNSTDAQSAIDDFVQVLTDGGANTAQTNLIRAIFIIDSANTLFFTPDNSNGDKLEADLDGYISAIDCTSCAFGNFTNGDPGGEIPGPGTYTNTATHSEGWWCGEAARSITAEFNQPVVVSNITILTGVISYCSPSHNGFCLWLDGSKIYENSTPPAEPVTCDKVDILSASDFSASFVVSEVS
jgi:hypothetical protein